MNRRNKKGRNSCGLIWLKFRQVMIEVYGCRAASSSYWSRCTISLQARVFILYDDPSPMLIRC